MRRILIVIGMMAFMAASADLQALSLVCRTADTKDARLVHVKIFRMLVDRNLPKPALSMVIDSRISRLDNDGNVSVGCQADLIGPLEILTAKYAAGRVEWDLAGEGKVNFESVTVRFSTFHGRVIYLPPGRHKAVEVLENCYLDATEVGFTVKNN